MAFHGAFILPHHGWGPTSPHEKAGETERAMSEMASRSSTHQDVQPEEETKEEFVQNRARSSTSSHSRVVFSDPVAFRYLEEDPATVVLARWKRLAGFEMYVVEQWACSRTHPTFLIATYTAEKEKSILVNVLGVPSEKSSWSPRLKLYFDALEQFHAKEMDTPLGTIAVTNLSGFPSALTVIPVPDGDVKKHREDFFVNENLKRMGCAGRAAINLQHPPSSTVAKFHQLYHTSEGVEIYQAVMELVKVCQTALHIYGKLQEAYIDGLLCDFTEKAITEWWSEIGAEFFNIEPSDGILGPTTVAAVLGLLIGAYNRLKSYGTQVPKDVLDVASMKRTISSFQKSAKMERSRRLNRETLDRLHRATAKTATGESWSVPKAVKSTVAELTGKGGEMVMGVVGGGREKVGISEVETWDIDSFKNLVVGAKMKWLWQGKSKPSDMFTRTTDDLNGRVFSTDDQGGFIWTGKSEAAPEAYLERTDTLSSTHGPDSRSGFGRIKEAVGGLKSERRQKDEHLADIHGLSPIKSFDRPSTPDVSATDKGDAIAAQNISLAAAPVTPEKKMKEPDNLRPSVRSIDTSRSYRQQLRPATTSESPRKKKIRMDMALLREEFKSPIYQNFASAFKYDGPRSTALRRSQSAVQMVDPGPLGDGFPRQNRLNRQLSFSIVEASILSPKGPLGDNDIVAKYGPESVMHQMAIKEALVADAQQRSRRILRTQRALLPFTESKVAHVENLDAIAQRHLQDLNNLYYQKLEEYQTLRATSSDVVGQEKNTLSDSLRRVEMLGAKLDYELNALQSRMQEVEDGVEEFERSVLEIEGRVKEVIGDEGRGENGWMQRVMGMLKLG
jgi:hypothetical protein